MVQEVWDLILARMGRDGIGLPSCTLNGKKRPENLTKFLTQFEFLHFFWQIISAMLVFSKLSFVQLSTEFSLLAKVYKHQFHENNGWTAMHF